MSELLNGSVRKEVQDVFGKLEEPVHILFFGSKQNCEYCADTRQLVEEVVILSDKLKMSVHDTDVETALAKQYHVDKTPTLVIAGRKGKKIIDYGIRYAGLPSGHEFSTFIQDILLVSGRDSGLSEATRKILKSVVKPVYLQVFVTPT